MSKPARLHKQKDDIYGNLLNYIEAWVQTHAFLCLMVAMAILIALFTVLIFTLVGISSTDSGVVYNGFDRII